MTGVITQFTKLTVGRPRPGEEIRITSNVVDQHYTQTSLRGVCHLRDRWTPHTVLRLPRSAHRPILAFSTTVSGVSPAATPAVSDTHPRLPPCLITSSVSFAGQGFLAFYLAGKLHLFDRRGHAVSPFFSLSSRIILTWPRIAAQSMDLPRSA